MTYFLLVRDNTPEEISKLDLSIGDFKLVPTGINIAAYIFGGDYEEWLLDNLVTNNLITSEMKTLYMNKTVEGNDYTTEVLTQFPTFLLGRGITPTSADDLKKHLEIHTHDENGELVISFDVDVSSATTISEVIQLYTNANKLIVIKKAE